MPHRPAIAAALTAALCLAVVPARAQTDAAWNTQPAAPAPAATPSVADSIPALASAAAFKKMLADRGINLQVTYVGETLADVAGGRRRGAVYDGRIDAVLEADMGKIAGLDGGTFHVEGYDIQGHGLTANYVGSLEAVSSIEALATVRLYELWYEQSLLGGKIALRAGQLGADTDFTTSKYALFFVNATTGWPSLLSADLPSGGPAYPFSAPGARVKIQPSAQWTFIAGIYDGDPAGPGIGDPQERNRYGVNFRVTDPPLLMQELQYSYSLGPSDAGLAGTVKLGAWEHFGDFPDQRTDGWGLLLGTSGAMPRVISGNHGIYGIIDQQLLRAGTDGSKGVGWFGRAFAAPGDRNPVDFYVDTGFDVSGLVPGRPEDSFGVAFAFTHVSDSLRSAAAAAGLTPLPDYEALMELTYQAQIVPGWSVQPVVQYIIHPGARLSGTNYRNATVVGLRTTITY